MLASTETRQPQTSALQEGFMVPDHIILIRGAGTSPWLVSCGDLIWSFSLLLASKLANTKPHYILKFYYPFSKLSSSTFYKTIKVRVRVTIDSDCGIYECKYSDFKCVITIITLFLPPLVSQNLFLLDIHSPVFLLYPFRS